MRKYRYVNDILKLERKVDSTFPRIDGQKYYV